MKKYLTIIVVLGVSSLLFAPQTNRQDYTMGEPNGYEWNSMTFGWKLGFLEGLKIGSTSGRNETLLLLKDIIKISWEDNLRFFELLKDGELGFHTVTLEQLIEGIDELYKDYANKRIPITRIAVLVYNRIRGSILLDDLEKELRILRVIHK